LSVTLAEICRLYANKERILAKEDQVREVYWVAHAHLVRLKRVHKKVQLKEFRLVKQGLCELESEERGFNLKDLETVLYSPVVESSTTLRSPSADLFFNPSFSLLPDLISFNTP